MYDGQAHRYTRVIYESKAPVSAPATATPNPTGATAKSAYLSLSG